MRLTLKTTLIALAAALTIGAFSTTADARPWGHGGWGHPGGWGHRGWGGFGPGFVGGLSLGTFAAGPYYYGGPGYIGGGSYYAAGWGGDCYMRRRVHYTPWGPRVRFV